MKDCRWVVSALCAIFAGERERSTRESSLISLDRVLNVVVRNDIRCIDNLDRDLSQNHLVRPCLPVLALSTYSVTTFVHKQALLHVHIHRTLSLSIPNWLPLKPSFHQPTSKFLGLERIS